MGQTTPKKRQAVASVNKGAPQRIYKGDYSYKFVELDATLLALADVKHEEIVKSAVDAGLDPGLFTSGAVLALKSIVFSRTDSHFARPILFHPKR